MWHSYFINVWNSRQRTFSHSAWKPTNVSIGEWLHEFHRMGIVKQKVQQLRTFVKSVYAKQHWVPTNRFNGTKSPVWANYSFINIFHTHTAILLAMFISTNSSRRHSANCELVSVSLWTAVAQLYCFISYSTDVNSLWMSYRLATLNYAVL